MRINFKLFQLSILLCLSGTLYSQKEWESDVLHNIQDNRTDGKTSFFKTISASTYVLSVAAPATYLVTGLINHDKYLKKTALYITESIVISEAITFATKAIVKRPRPGVDDATLHPVTNANNYSFPSGHTSAAFALATSLSIIEPKWYVIVPSFTWAAFVGYSRMYLGVHYPSDVIAGALLGTGSAWLSYRLNKWMRQQPKASKVKAVPAL